LASNCTGANRPNRPKTTEKTSTLRHHGTQPKHANPANVRAEYIANTTEMLRGTSRPGATSSNHANKKNSAQAGQAASHLGYGSRSDRSLRQGFTNRSANSNSAVQGLISVQTLPTKAQTKPSPTHHTIQTATGAIFLKVL
jgi:hypothetical protein